MKALNKFGLVLCVLLASSAQAKQLVVAVLDTGIDQYTNKHLCKTGHKSYVAESALVDSNGHGTHIAGLIEKYAQDKVDYCIIAVKYYQPSNLGKQNLLNLVAALAYVVDRRVDFINISGGGSEPDQFEHAQIMRALNAGITIVAAAGNEHMELKYGNCKYFPACYDSRIVTVGNLQWDYATANKALPRQRVVPYNPASHVAAYSSNYGEYVTRWEHGQNVQSTLPGNKYGYMSGTSQATAIATGKLLKETNR
jgi:subtilisin family serine protease